MLWVAAIAEVGGPLLISYFIDAKVATHQVEWQGALGLAAAFYSITNYCGTIALLPNNRL